MKTKITSKNKNVINIKINTERKEKVKRKKRVAKRPSSPKGRSSYSGGGGGYGNMPPIIIQPHQPMVFPQYNQPDFINQVRDTNHIINHTNQQQPVEDPPQSHIPIAHIVNEPSIPLSPFINSTATTPIPIAQSISKKPHHSKVEKNNDFINDTSTHPVSIAKALDDEADVFENYYTPNKKPHSSPNLDTIQNYYDNNETNEDNNDALFTNPMISLTGLRKEPEPEVIDLVQKAKKDKNNLSRANYHSKADDFSLDKYNSLLEKYYSLNPNLKVDSEFEGKKGSRSLYAKLMGKVNKAERKKQPRQVDEPLELIPLQVSKKKKKNFVILP